MAETKWFEAWFLRQFKGNKILLKKDADGAYTDETVNAMFIGFSAAWAIK